MSSFAPGGRMWRLSVHALIWSGRKATPID
jgi:hypothetical protein